MSKQKSICWYLENSQKDKGTLFKGGHQFLKLFIALPMITKIHITLVIELDMEEVEKAS